MKKYTTPKTQRDLHDIEILIEQGKIELEKARSYFEDANTMIERALALQWMIDQSSDTGPYRTNFGLSNEIDEMLEQLDYYHSRLDDPGDEGYEDLTKSSYLEQVHIEFTKEAVQRSFEKKKIDRDSQD